MKLTKDKLFYLHSSCKTLLSNQVRRIQKWSKILCQGNQEILKASKNNCNSSRALQPMYPSWLWFAEGVLQVALFSVLLFKRSVKKHCVEEILLAIWEYFYMKIIVTIIPTGLVPVHFYPLFALSYKPKPRIRFSASWWSGNEKYFCFLFITSRALLQSYAEFNRLL